MSLAIAIVQVLLGLGFTINGSMKLIGRGPSPGHFVHFGYPRWFLTFTGGVELLVGLGMLLGFWLPVLVPLAALLLIATMIGALYTHRVRGKDPLSALLPPTVVLVLALFMAAMSWPTLMHLLAL
jgi:putative oxidoreductase